MASCVLDFEKINLRIDRRRTQGFIVDYKTYFYSAQTLNEAHYLCAILNAPCVNEAIKKYQSQGLFGHRDITRTPFEACAIPMFKADDADHQALARLSIIAHEKINEMIMYGDKKLAKGVVATRNRAREHTAAEIEAIDEIARRVIAE